MVKQRCALFLSLGLTPQPIRKLTCKLLKMKLSLEKSSYLIFITLSSPAFVQSDYIASYVTENAIVGGIFSKKYC